jgi:hypothetical protein
MAGFGDRNARLAHAAGLDGRRLALAVGADAVEGARDDARRRRLAHAAYARQHEGVRNAPRCERVGERFDERFLADETGEIRWAIFSRQNAIGRILPARFRRRGIKAQRRFVAHRPARRDSRAL